jgi:hypothetical protein
MPSVFGAAVLVINVLFFLLTTWSSAVAPESFAARLGLGIANAGGINEIRAQYSGFFLAVALVCAASLFGLLSRQTSFIILGLVFGGLFVGRLVSLALNGGVVGYGPTIVALCAIDAIGLALAIASFVLDRRAKG